MADRPRCAANGQEQRLVPPGAFVAASCFARQVFREDIVAVTATQSPWPGPLKGNQSNTVTLALM